MRTARQVSGFLWRNRRFGGRVFRVMDMLTMSAYDYLSKWFEDDRIKAVLAYYASIGTFAGPRTPGSAYVIMHHVMGENAGAGGWGFIKGGMGVDHASAGGERAGEGRGDQDRQPDRARQCCSGGRATGVVTQAGDAYEAPLVIANVNAKLLYLDMVGRRAPARRTGARHLQPTARSRPRSR